MDLGELKQKLVTEDSIISQLPDSGMITKTKVINVTLESDWRVIWYQKRLDGSYDVKLQQVTNWHEQEHGKN